MGEYDGRVDIGTEWNLKMSEFLDSDGSIRLI